MQRPGSCIWWRPAGSPCVWTVSAPYSSAWRRSAASCWGTVRLQSSISFFLSYFDKNLFTVVTIKPSWQMILADCLLTFCALGFKGQVCKFWGETVTQSGYILDRRALWLCLPLLSLPVNYGSLCILAWIHRPPSPSLKRWRFTLNRELADRQQDWPHQMWQCKEGSWEEDLCSTYIYTDI